MDSILGYHRAKFLHDKIGWAIGKPLGAPGALPLLRVKGFGHALPDVRVLDTVLMR